VPQLAISKNAKKKFRPSPTLLYGLPLGGVPPLFGPSPTVLSSSASDFVAPGVPGFTFGRLVDVLVLVLPLLVLQVVHLILVLPLDPPNGVPP